MKEVIFKLLDILKYNLVDINDRIYFVKKIGDEYAEIRYDKSDGWCYISYELTTFFSSITGFQRPEVQELIVKWVEHTLQMEVKYNCTLRSSALLKVEHTLQMEVKYNNAGTTVWWNGVEHTLQMEVKYNPLLTHSELNVLNIPYN